MESRCGAVVIDDRVQREMMVEQYASAKYKKHAVNTISVRLFVVNFRFTKEGIHTRITLDLDPK